MRLGRFRIVDELRFFAIYQPPTRKLLTAAWGSMSVIGMFQQSSFRDRANSTAFIDLPVLRT